MKKLLIPAILALLVFLYVFYPVRTVYAKTNPTVSPIKTTPTPLESEVSDETTSTSARIEYTLPYPGILPDNPLHFLKAVRDRIVLFLIQDSIKKAEFNLLTSDKRVYAARLLADRGKDDLAMTTLSKSNNYFHQAIAATNDAQKAGKSVDIVLHNLKSSAKKHLEVLLMIEKSVDKNFASQLQYERTRLNDFEKSVEQLSSK